jgi:hypothetical protein
MKGGVGRFKLIIDSLLVSRPRYIRHNHAHFSRLANRGLRRRQRRRQDLYPEVGRRLFLAAVIYLPHE